MVFFVYDDVDRVYILDLFFFDFGMSIGIGFSR